MRLPRVRFTVRRLRITVAIVGLVLAGVIDARRRRERFLRIADFHERRSPNGYAGFYLVPLSPTDEWHDQMGQKYRRAAARPWLPVAPDPPAPCPEPAAPAPATIAGHRPGDRE